MPASTAATLSLDFPAELRAIRDVLRFAGYTAEGIAAALGTAGLEPIRHRNPWQIQVAAEKAGPLGVLMQVFLTPGEVDLKRFRDAVAPTDPEIWAKVGLVQLDAEGVAGLVELHPHNGLVFACDRDDPLGELGRGFSEKQVLLEQLLIHSGVRSMLHLAAGNGLVALSAAAAGCDRVIAVAETPSRRHLARFNALLNSARGIEFPDDAGSAAERAVDLIAGRTGLVVPPDDRPIPEDAPTGDAPLPKLIRFAAERLKEGGYAQILGTWMQVAGETEATRFAKWLADLKCDALVLRESTADPADYSAKRLAGGHLSPDADGYGAAFRKGLSYFDRVRAEAIHSGMIVLRKRSHGVNWTLLENLPAERVGPCGESIVNLFKMQDFLRGFSDPMALLDVRLQLAPDTYLAQKCEPADGGWQIFESVLTRKSGLRFSGDVQMPVAPIVPQLNGRQTLRELLPSIARQFRMPVDQLIPAALDRIVQMLIYGLVVPTPRIKTVI